MSLKQLFILIFLVLGSSVKSQNVWLLPNEGQWNKKIEYKVDLQMGEMLIEKDGFRFFLNDVKQTFRHSHDSDSPDEHPETYKAHVIKSTFLDSKWGREVENNKPSRFYTNYILGNDVSTWKGNIYSYSDVLLLDYYEGIDLRLDGEQGFKYSFEVAPLVDASVIRIQYEGQNSLKIDEKGQLVIENRFGEIIEGTPVAWTENDKGRTEVEVHYSLKKDVIEFVFPKGYDNSEKLVIDPSLTFSTFTGSTADNWGTSATPDASGNLFAGGVVFATGYPVTVGAYDASFNAGGIDIGLTKFTADGTALIYSTYIGGNGSETPNSMICSPTGELFIYGLTSSSNFPMAGASFDNTFAGGPNVSSVSNGLGFAAGTDLFVLRLNATGSALLASTYIGGTSTDGLNFSNLKYNYGDQFRGEITLDNAGSVYVASMSMSADFPVSGGGQMVLSGTQDAVLLKMPTALNAIDWATFIGDVGVETGNSVQLASTGEVYIAGGSTSPGLFTAGFDLNYAGGLSDGYVARINPTDGSMLSGTYIGLAEYDQTYFVQLDIEDNVYVLGQTESDLGITAGLYGNANSGQFIHKYTTDLLNLQWKTMLGASTGHVEISPTAFLISDCHDIYLSGWGGTLNQNTSNSQAFFSTTNGFPVTSDAYQLSTTGSNFYIAVLGQDANQLKYGTFMGGNTTSPDHVDGGTSRFDKNGNIYHAVCAACGGQANGFTTTPGVYSPTNNSGNCNLAAFKFELNKIEAIISDPNPVVCLPDSVVFSNNSANGNNFYWDFGDGEFSTEVNPSHLYPGPGDYDVTLVVSDTNGCFLTDSVEFLVHVGDFVGFVAQPPGPICPFIPYELEASGGVNYSWSPGINLDDSTSATPIAIISETTTFTVIVSDTCGADTLEVTLFVITPPHSVVGDTSICLGNSVPIGAAGGISYEWHPGVTLSDSTIANPIATPFVTTTYLVEIQTQEGCVLIDSVVVDVFFLPPVPVMPDSLFMCAGSSIDITVSGGDTYLWSPNFHISNTTGPNVTVHPPADMYYYCDFTNICATIPDSVFIKVIEVEIETFGDTIICPGETVPLIVTGGTSYTWSPATSLSSNQTSLVFAHPNTSTMYYVTGVDQYGCVDTDSVFVELFPIAYIQASADVYAFIDDQIQLSATSTTNGQFIWDPAEFLSCVVCDNPIANPNQNYFYTVSYTDGNGCSDSDTVKIFYDPIIYVPNTFTPGENSFNPIFKVKGGNISTFLLEIYNRWGELIFTSNDISIGWDGTYNNLFSQDGTYIWKLYITGISGEATEYVGHINLLR